MSQSAKNEAYPQIAPNFIALIRSNWDTEENVHQKMCLYMNAGVEVSDCHLLIMIIFNNINY